MPELLVTEAQLKNNTVPVLGLAGEIDPLRVTNEAMHDAMPNVKLVILEGADHVSATFHPRFIETLQRFIADAGIDTVTALQEE